MRFLCYAKPVTIGSDCRFGAGSMVTRSIPANSFAAGVPARVIREITEADAIAGQFPELRRRVSSSAARAFL